MDFGARAGIAAYFIWEDYKMVLLPVFGAYPTDLLTNGIRLKNQWPNVTGKKNITFSINTPSYHQ